MRPLQQQGLPGGYRPMSAPANMQWAARPAAGQVGVGQPQGTASGAAGSVPRPAGAITQQQMQQHLLAKGGGAAHGGLAAVGQGQQALYQPPAGYLQHGQLPAPSMPLVHRPPGAPGAPITGSVQAQGAWRPNAPFGPASAAGVPQQQVAPHPSATAPAVHVGGALPGTQAHAQQIDLGQTGMVTFAAEPVKEPAPSTAQQTVGSTGAIAEAPSAAAAGATEGKTPMVPALDPGHSQSAPQPSNPVAAVLSGQAGVPPIQTGARALPASDALAAQLPEPLPVVGPA